MAKGTRTGGSGAGKASGTEPGQMMAGTIGTTDRETETGTGGESVTETGLMKETGTGIRTETATATTALQDGGSEVPMKTMLIDDVRGVLRTHVLGRDRIVARMIDLRFRDAALVPGHTPAVDRQATESPHVPVIRDLRGSALGLCRQAGILAGGGIPQRTSSIMRRATSAWTRRLRHIPTCERESLSSVTRILVCWLPAPSWMHKVVLRLRRQVPLPQVVVQVEAHPEHGLQVMTGRWLHSLTFGPASRVSFLLRRTLLGPWHRLFRQGLPGLLLRPNPRWAPAESTCNSSCAP